MEAIVMQPLRLVSASETQEMGTVLDVGGYTAVSLQLVRIRAVSPDATIVFQTAPVLRDDAFSDIGSPVSLASAGSNFISTSALLRYLRWKVVYNSGSIEQAFEVHALCYDT